MCQRREQHHVRVLADDAHFRYTNSKSQLSHETISSHDSSMGASASYRQVKNQSYPPSRCDDQLAVALRRLEEHHVHQCILFDGSYCKELQAKRTFNSALLRMCMVTHFKIRRVFK